MPLPARTLARSAPHRVCFHLLEWPHRIRRAVTREDPLLSSLRRQRLSTVTAALAGTPQREPADVTLPELQPPFPPSRLLGWATPARPQFDAPARLCYSVSLWPGAKCLP